VIGVDSQGNPDQCGLHHIGIRGLGIEGDQLGLFDNFDQVCQGLRGYPQWLF
jgi:hypothetical protein